jgi:predicted RecA/RadA family phage recombinase
MSFDAKDLHYGDRIPYTATGAVAAGDVIVMGTTTAGASLAVCAVATNNIAAGATDWLAINGVKELPTDGTAFTVGEAVYWNASSYVATHDSTYYYFGVCVVGCAAGANVHAYLRSLEEVYGEKFATTDLSDVTTMAKTAGFTPVGQAPLFQSALITTTSLSPVASAAVGTGVLIYATLTATGAEAKTVIASTPVALRITGAHIIGREASTTPTVTLASENTGAADPISAAITKSATDDTIVRAATIVEPVSPLLGCALPAGSAIYAVTSGAGVFEVVIKAVVAVL